MTPLRVLITNLSLTARSGTEMYTRDLALELLRRGHTPIVYSLLHGVVADELRQATVTVLDDLTRLAEPPDVIHGHHHPETMTALLQFPHVPALFVCHDRTVWHDNPPRFPRLRRYVAVDENCRERLTQEHGIAPEQTALILNSVDLRRFRPRGPLPERPRRALVFSHYATEHTHLKLVREACARAGLELEVAGNASGRPCPHPEDVLGKYDVVFAKARCALEALAVGIAVVLIDHLGCGPLIHTGNLARLRPLNLGRRACQNPLHVEVLLEELGRYNATDATEVSRRVRAEAGVEGMVDALLVLYRKLLEEQHAAPRVTSPEELRATAHYLRHLMPFQLILQQMQRAELVEQERDQCRRAAESVHQQTAALQERITLLEQERHHCVRSAEQAHAGWAELHRHYERLAAECQRLQQLLTESETKREPPSPVLPPEPSARWFRGWRRGKRNAA